MNRSGAINVSRLEEQLASRPLVRSILDCQRLLPGFPPLRGVVGVTAAADPEVKEFLSLRSRDRARTSPCCRGTKGSRPPLVTQGHAETAV